MPPSLGRETTSGTRHAVADQRFAAALVTLGVAAFLLRLVRLGHQSLWIDEILSYGWIAEIRTHGFGSLLHDIHGPLHALAVYAASQVSTSEWWLRLPSAVAGALAVPALGLLGRALWGRAAGVAAAVAMAVSPFALYYAQECRNYSFTFLFATLASHAALVYARAPGARRAALLVVAEILAITSNLNGLFFATGIALWGLVTLRTRRRALGLWIGAQALAVLVLLPYAWEITHQVRPERMVGVESDFGAKERLRGATTLHPMAVPYTAYAFAVGYSLGPTLEELRSSPASAARPRHLPFLLGVATAFGVALVAGLRRARRAGGLGLLAWPALVTLGFTVWLAAANVKPYNVRYLSVVLPAFLLVVGLGVVSLGRRARLVVGGLGLGLCLVSCAGYLFVPRYGRDDVRGAVAYVAEHAAPGDAILQISLTAAMRHYYTALGARPVHPPEAASASPAGARAWVGEALRGATTAWYFECRPQALDPQGHLREALESAAQSVEIIPFVGIRVFRLDLGPPGSS